MRILITLAVLLCLQACKHPLQIRGEGDPPLFFDDAVKGHDRLRFRIDVVVKWSLARKPDQKS